MQAAVVSNNDEVGNNGDDDNMDDIKDEKKDEKNTEIGDDNISHR